MTHGTSEEAGLLLHAAGVGEDDARARPEQQHLQERDRSTSVAASTARFCSRVASRVRGWTATRPGTVRAMRSSAVTMFRKRSGSSRILRAMNRRERERSRLPRRGQRARGARPLPDRREPRRTLRRRSAPSAAASPSMRRFSMASGVGQSSRSSDGPRRRGWPLRAYYGDDCAARLDVRWSSAEPRRDQAPPSVEFVSPKSRTNRPLRRRAPAPGVSAFRRSARRDPEPTSSEK